jgi:hypothetical protein
MSRAFQRYFTFVLQVVMRDPSQFMIRDSVPLVRAARTHYLRDDNFTQAPKTITFGLGQDIFLSLSRDCRYQKLSIEPKFVTIGQEMLKWQRLQLASLSNKEITAIFR